MDKKTFLVFLISLVVVVIMMGVVNSMNRRLPENTRAIYKSVKGRLDANINQMEGMEKKLNRLVDKYPKLLKPHRDDEGWAQKVDLAKESLRKGESIFDREAKPIYKKNRKDDSRRLMTALKQSHTAQTSGLAAMQGVLDRADVIVGYMENADAMADKAREDHAAISRMTLGALLTKVEQAKQDWPQKRDDLNRRVETFDNFKVQAEENVRIINEESVKEPSLIDYQRFGSSSEALTAIRKNFKSNISSLWELIDQLYYSYDIILEDMEIREGDTVEFYQKYKTVKIDRENNSTQDTSWSQVSEAAYKKNEKNLGMVLETKPKGLYDFEADKVASPPGYSYVGNRSYGEWRRDNYGRSNWAFLPLYAFMPSLWWGPYYQPIYRSDYGRYRRNHDYGRPYYGRGSGGTSRYGTGGSYTSRRYAYSRHSTNKGFANTRYKKSGGAYKGSRYASPVKRTGTKKRTVAKRSTGRSVRSVGRSYGGGYGGK